MDFKILGQGQGSKPEYLMLAVIYTLESTAFKRSSGC